MMKNNYYVHYFGKAEVRHWVFIPATENKKQEKVLKSSSSNTMIVLPQYCLLYTIVLQYVHSEYVLVYGIYG